VSNDDENRQRHTIFENRDHPRVQKVLPLHERDIKKSQEKQ
jgi:hypothetical protein